MIPLPAEPGLRRLLAAVVLLSLALNVTGIWWGLPSLYGWAVDELHPRVILAGIETRFSGDWHQPAYPPLHYYVLAASYLPVLLFGGVDPLGVEGHSLFFALGRLISVTMAVGIVLILYRIGRDLFDPASGLFAALGMALAPPFVYYSKTANLEVPLLFWLSLSLFFFLRALTSEELRDYLGFTLSAVLAMGTKDQAFAFYVLPLAGLLARRVRREGSFLRALLDRRLVLSLALGLLSFLALHNVVFNYQGFVHHFEEILWARGQYSHFEGTLAQQLTMLRQTVVHLGFTLGWPLFAISVLGVGLAFRERGSRPLPLWLPLFGISYYGFFIAPVLSTWLRYALPIAALFALFAGFGSAFLWRRSPWGRAALSLALLYSLARAASLDALLLHDSRYDAERWLAQHVAEGEVVGYMGPEYYLPRLHQFHSKRLRPTDTVLAREQPVFLVVNRDYASRFEPGTREYELFSRLFAGRTAYGRVFQHRSEPSSWLLSFEGVLENMGKIGPPIEIYQRTDR